MFDDEKAVFSEQWRTAELVEAGFIEVFALVGWIDERDVEVRLHSIERSGEIHFENLESIFNFQRFQILSNDLACLSRLIDEIHRRSAATDCLNTDCSHSRTAIQKHRTIDARPEDVEDGFSQLVARRPNSRRGCTFQAPASKFSGNDSHAGLLRRDEFAKLVGEIENEGYFVELLRLRFR